MKRVILRTIQVAIIIVVIPLMFYSYDMHKAADLAKQAYDALGADKYESAMALADEALLHNDTNELAIYVRGISRYKFLVVSQSISAEGLAKCKADLSKALELTKNESIKKNCHDFLLRIVEVQGRLQKDKHDIL